MSKHIIPITYNQLFVIVISICFVGWIQYTFVDFQSFGGGFLGAIIALTLITVITYCTKHNISFGWKK